MKPATSIVLLATVALLQCPADRALAAVIAHWTYETSGGSPVVVGQAAAGQQVDDTGGFATGPFHATGFGGTLSYQAGVFGSTHSLKFTEATTPNYDYVARNITSDSAIKDLTQGAFTLETWFKTADTGRGVLIGTYDGNPNNALNFEIHTKRLRGYVASSAGITDFYSPTDNRIADGQWHHAALVRDSALGTVRLYLDGLQVTSVTDKAGAFTLSPTTIYLARDSRTDSTRFDGYLDNTRISNTALTPLQFHMSGPGEQNYYRMETDGGITVSAGQGAAVVDDTGLHPFTYNGQALPSGTPPRYSRDVPAFWIQRGDTGAPNAHSLSFSGASDYVELGNQPLLRTLTQENFTIEFFLKTPLRSDRAVIVGTYDGSTAQMLNLEIGGATHGANQGHLRPFFGITSGTFDTFWGATNISDNEWHHVALVRSGAGTASDLVQLYVDYQLDGQMALHTGQYTLRPTFFRLGGDSRGSGFYYQGLLDEFRIWRGALSVADFLLAVPEPSSLLLAVFGLIGLAAFGRWRRF